MGVTFPNESPEYRAARNKLLQREVALRREMEAVAAEIRALPRGGSVPEDYEFDHIDAKGAPAKVRLSELFRPGTDTLIVYHYMSYCAVVQMSAHDAKRTSVLISTRGQLLAISHQHQAGESWTGQSRASALVFDGLGASNKGVQKCATTAFKPSGRGLRRLATNSLHETSALAHAGSLQRKMLKWRFAFFQEPSLRFPAR